MDSLTHMSSDAQAPKAAPRWLSELRKTMTLIEALMLGQLLGASFGFRSERYPWYAVAVVLWVVLVRLGLSYWRCAAWPVGAMSAVVWGALGFVVMDDLLSCPRLAPLVAAVVGTLAVCLRISDWRWTSTR